MNNPPMRHPRPNLPAGVLALVSTLALTACGQKGPLYLPDTVGEVVTRPTQTPAAEPAPGVPATGAPASGTPTPAAPAPSAPNGDEKAKPAAPPPLAR